MNRMYASFFSEMRKIAEEKQKSRALELAKIIGSGALGFGVGTGAGLGVGYLGDRLSSSITGKKIPRSVLYGALPLLGAASGIAYSVHKAKEQEAIRHALQDSADSRAR